MRFSLIFLLALGIVFAAEPCISCGELSDAPQARLFTVVNQNSLEITAFYENLSADPSRLPIADYILLLEVADNEGNQLEFYRIYLDSQGHAEYDFSSLSDQCLAFKVLYCPFCDPESPACGFEACLNYSGIETGATSVNDVPVVPGQSVPGTLNDRRFLPALSQRSYCPPPPPLGATPSMCFPLLLIFSLLAGSMYLTGNNPFAGLNVGGARMGRHIKYQARGRGYAFSTMAAVSAGISVGTAVKTLAESGGAGLANLEKRSAHARFLGGGLMQVGRGVGALSAAKRAAAGKKGKERSETMTRTMEAGTSMWTQEKGMSAKEKSMTAQQTGAGTMTHLPGGGAVRSGDTVYSGGGFWGNIFGTMGQMVLVIMTQTTIGRIVDGYLYLGNRKGMMERLGITKHEKRMAEDLKAAADMMGEGQEGIIVNVGGTAHVVKKAIVDAEGNTVYVIESPSYEGGKTTRQITVDDKGKVVGMSYPMQVTADMARNHKGLKEGETVMVNISSHTQTINGKEVSGDVIRIGASAGEIVIMEPGKKADSSQQDLWREVSHPASQGGAGGFTLGANVSEFQDTYRANKAALSTIVASAAMEASIASMHSGESIESMLRQNPESRQIVANLRQQTAQEDLALLIGVAPDEMTAGGKGTKHLGGVKGESSDFGERSSAEQATIKINEAHSSSELGDMPQFSGKATKASGLEGTANAGAFGAALTAVVSSSSAGELQGMSEKELRGAVRQQMVEGFVGQGLPPHMAEDRADAALGSANMGAVTQQVNAAGSGLIQNFREQGFNETMVGALSRADVSQVQQVAGTGALMADSRTAELVARSQSTDYRLDPETERAVNQHRILTQAQQHIQGMQTGTDAGNFTVVAMQHQQAVEVQNLYWHAKADSAVAGDPEVPQQKETVIVGGAERDLTIAEQAQTGTNMAFQGTQMMHRMQVPGMGAEIEKHVKQEETFRSQILADVASGNMEAAKQLAEQRAEFYRARGDVAGAAIYDNVAIQIGSTQPGTNYTPVSTVSQNVEATFSQAPHADAFASRTAAIEAEASRENQRTGQVLDYMQQGDYSTARTLAAGAYKYHKEQGNEAEAQKWIAVVEQTSLAQTGKPKDPVGKTREILGEPEYKPPEPPANFEAMPENKQESYVKKRMGYDMAYGQKQKEAWEEKLQPAAATYGRAVQYAGEGYGHIIDAADRAGRYSQADES